MEKLPLSSLLTASFGWVNSLLVLGELHSETRTRIKNAMIVFKRTIFSLKL
jgi:hypothetical protein